MRRLRALGLDGYDALAGFGLLLVAWGLWGIYPPLAPLVVGLAIVAAVIWRAALEVRGSGPDNQSGASPGETG